ncbi:MAG: sigma-54 dependent transcriptional regulator [Rickettsiales bacterium]
MRLMIVGDLGGQLGAASKIAKDRGAKVVQVPSVATALDSLCSGNGADVLMVEISHDIEKLAQMLIAEHISVPIVACGVKADAKLAVAAIRAGAKEFIPLPPDEELIAAVLEAITEESHSVIFKSPAMLQVMQMVDKIAAADASVLITGESGTGKEVIARYIHRKSVRSGKPFISVNCAAIPDNLLESELFGHEKGAFTGAMMRRIGKFEEANNGTLLLDEISEMDLKLQAKLLRAIQEREFDRLGSNSPVKVNIRILATSNRNLLEHAKSGKFREDLYYRLNVINVALPPLRERKEDIMPLADHFIAKYSKANGLPPRKFTDGALAKMQQYQWPGNVRELENIMHRAVLMAQGPEIDEAAVMLPQQFMGTAVPVENTSRETAANTPRPDGFDVAQLVGRSVADVEKDLILQTLDHCLGNRTHAANILGISIRTLRNKLREYGVASDAA